MNSTWTQSLQQCVPPPNCCQNFGSTNCPEISLRDVARQLPFTGTKRPVLA